MNLPMAPATYQEIIAAYGAAHKDMAGRVKTLSDAEWNSSITWMIAPRQMARCVALISSGWW